MQRCHNPIITTTSGTQARRSEVPKIELWAPKGILEGARSSADVMLLVRVPRCCSRLPLSFSSSRTYASASSLPPLPPLEEWRTLFPWGSGARRDRVFLSNLDTARKVARSFIKDSPTNGKGKVVVEAFPGACYLSCLLAGHPRFMHEQDLARCRARCWSYPSLR